MAQKIDADPTQPLYRQLETDLVRRIRANELRPGDRLPSVRALARDLGLAPMTVWNALKALAARGIVMTTVGRGTFVTERAVEMLDASPGNTPAAPAPSGAATTRTVSLVLPNLGEPLAASISRGVRGGLSDSDLQISVLDTHADPAVEDEALRRSRHEGVAGIIIFPTTVRGHASELVRTVLDGPSVIIIDHHLRDVACRYVTSDNRRGGYLMAEHLIGRGRRRIAFVAHTLREVTIQQRLSGWMEAMGAAGVPVHYEYVRGAEAPSEQINPTVASLLALPTPPDAICFANDYDAIAGIRALKALGKRVPSDVAVVGYDDHPLAAIFEPALTTIRQDGAALGRAASELLLSTLTPRAATPTMERVVVPIELIIRRSG